MVAVAKQPLAGAGQSVAGARRLLRSRRISHLIKYVRRDSVEYLFYRAAAPFAIVILVAERLMDFSELQNRFQRDGYAVIRGMLSKDEAAQASSRVERLIREVLPVSDKVTAMYEDKSKPATIKQIQGLAAADSFFAQMQTSDRFMRLAEALLDGPVTPTEVQWFGKWPQLGKATPPHQDGYYFMLEPNEAVTMWLALDRVDDENGCVRYIPGSHRTGMRTHARTDVVGFSQGITDYGPDDRRRERSVHAQPGDLIVHHSLTIHAAGANQTSDRPRRALGMVYYAQRARQDLEGREQYRRQLHSELKAKGNM